MSACYAVNKEDKGKEKIHVMLNISPVWLLCLSFSWSLKQPAPLQHLPLLQPRAFIELVFLKQPRADMSAQFNSMAREKFMPSATRRSTAVGSRRCRPPLFIPGYKVLSAPTHLLSFREAPTRSTDTKRVHFKCPHKHVESSHQKYTR